MNIYDRGILLHVVHCSEKVLISVYIKMCKTQHCVKRSVDPSLFGCYGVTCIDCSYYFTLVRVGSTHEDISSQHHPLVSFKKTEAHDTAAHQVAKTYIDYSNGKMHLGIWIIWYGFEIMKFPMASLTPRRHTYFRASFGLL